VEVARKYIKLRTFFQAYSSRAIGEKHEGDAPPTLDHFRVLDDKHRSRIQFNCLLSFLEEVANVFDSSPFAEEEAIDTLRRFYQAQLQRQSTSEANQKPPPKETPPLSPDERPTPSRSKLQERIQRIEQSLQHRGSTAAPGTNDGAGRTRRWTASSLGCPAPAKPAATASSSPVSLAAFAAVKRWHWDCRITHSVECAPPIFQLVHQQPNHVASALLSPEPLSELLAPVAAMDRQELKVTAASSTGDGGASPASAQAQELAVLLRLLFSRGPFVGMELVRGTERRTSKQHFTNLDFSGVRPTRSTIVVGDQHGGSALCFRKV